VVRAQDKHHGVWSEAYKVIFDGTPGDLIEIIKLGKIGRDVYSSEIRKKMEEKL
jgi:hypothetical protein